MARLIDANDIAENLMDSNWFDCDDIDVALQAVKLTDTIDPESLRPHGEWIVLQIDNYSNCAIFGCSQCKTSAGIITRPTWRFCPHCGAKMEDTNEN